MYKNTTNKTITFFTLKQSLISTCKILRSLSYFKTFVSIKKDLKTFPNGRLIIIKYK